MKNKIKLTALVISALFFFSTLYGMSENNINHKITKNNYTGYSDIGWHLHQINITGAWDLSAGSPEITIAVIDSGIDFNHSEVLKEWINVDEFPADGIDDDLNGYIDDVRGWDFVNNDSEPRHTIADPVHWHATFIAGIIIAPLDDYGVVGVAPNVTVMNIRVLDSGNMQGTTDGELGDAIKYAVDNGADVINLSLQYYYPNSTYLDDIQYAISKNVSVVSVTGNTWTGGIDFQSFPGGFDEVISVGATNSFYQKAFYSNFGSPWTELMAPVGDGEGGLIINSTFPPPSIPYGNAIGTSFAAPQVAAVIALMKSVNYTIPVAEIRSILQTTAIDLGTPGLDPFFGYGLINATAAVLEVYNRYNVPVVQEFGSVHISIILTIVISTMAVLPIALKRKEMKKI
jgi:subtilisin family serine protease